MKKAVEINVSFIKYYKTLERENVSPRNCLLNYENMCKEKWIISFMSATNDNDSRMGTYLQVNPTLSKPAYHSQLLLETDRLMLTRFRCGSHSLLIEKGRFSNIPRNERLCSCDTGVQTVLHCFSECPLTRDILVGNYRNLFDVFQDENICILIHKICNRLKISV